MKSKFFSPAFKACLHKHCFPPPTSFSQLANVNTGFRQDSILMISPISSCPLFYLLNFLLFIFCWTFPSFPPKQNFQLPAEHPSFLKPLIIGFILTTVDISPLLLNWPLKFSVSNFSWKNSWGGTWNANYLYTVTIIRMISPNRKIWPHCLQ